MGVGKTTPSLRIFDAAKAKEFYLDFLGFSVDGEHRVAKGVPLYMPISKAGCVIHLAAHHGDCSPGAAMRIEPNALEAFHKELLAQEYTYARPGLEEMPWGSREMSVMAPFGNRLRFTHAISTEPGAAADARSRSRR
jgi:glyoxalase superfamily protein